MNDDEERYEELQNIVSTLQTLYREVDDTYYQNEILSTLMQAEYDLEELDKRLAVERRNELKQQTNEYLEGRYN